MGKSGRLISVLVMVLIVTNVITPHVRASAATDTGLHSGVIKNSDNNTGVTFTVKTPWDQLTLDTTSANGKTYVKVALPGWVSSAQPGSPELPMLTETVGAPFGSDVSVAVTPGEAHVIKLQAPPLPTLIQKAEFQLPGSQESDPQMPSPVVVYEEDPAIYAGGIYPSDLALITNDGTFRQQRVVAVSVFPVQFDPSTMELTVYESLDVAITFTGATSSFSKPQTKESKTVEDIINSELLNSGTSVQWRQDSTPQKSLLSPQMITPDTGSFLPWTPPSPGYRISVRSDGMYRVTYAELSAAGVPVSSLDPRTFQVYNMGQEVAVVVSGEQDGKFDPSDSILFYGQGISSKYTSDNVYWLTYGKGQGLRMATKDGTPAVADSPISFTSHKHFEQNSYYVSQAPGDENLDRWFWDYLYPPSRPSWTYTFSLASPADGDGILSVSLLGFLDNATNPDHHVRVSLNGTQIGDLTWDGIAWLNETLTIPSGILLAGTNTLVLTDPNDTGVGYDVVYINSLDLDFESNFQSENNVLVFNNDTLGTWDYKVAGFSGNQVAAYDITDPVHPITISGTLSSKDKTTYTLQFTDSINQITQYWSGQDTSFKAVSSIVGDSPSNLQSTGNAADTILITPQAFATQTNTLRAYRASQGLRAVTVDIQDIYDEFSYGIVSASSIHDFLAYAYTNWTKPAPAYVLLIGDGHYDPKNYLGIGRISYIPPYLAPVDPWIGETAADNRYVALVGSDTLPDMMLGRLSVNTPAEAATMVNKIIAYEGNPQGGWQKQILAVADNADEGGNFAALSDNVIATLPSSISATRVHLFVNYATAADARNAIFSGINAGKLVVNYIGHASPAKWAEEGLLTTSDVAGLTNGTKMPIFLPMTCYDGYYLYPYNSSYDSLAEVITRAEGKGAIASWAPSGLGIATGHDSLDKGFMKAAFTDRVPTIGQATATGKLTLWATGANLDLLDTYLLFGDPELKFPISPTAITLNYFNAVASKKNVSLTWETATETKNVGFNLYRSDTLDGKKLKINANLIPSKAYPGSLIGTAYSFVDSGIGLKGGFKPKQEFYYWLEDVDIFGMTVLHGPVKVVIPNK